VPDPVPDPEDVPEPDDVPEPGGHHGSCPDPGVASLNFIKSLPSKLEPTTFCTEDPADDVGGRPGPGYGIHEPDPEDDPEDDPDAEAEPDADPEPLPEDPVLTVTVMSPTLDSDIPSVIVYEILSVPW